MIQTEIKSKLSEDICVMASPQNHPYSYLFDCGIASKLSISDVMRIKAVFVTHTHIDHFANFDAILRHKAGSRDPLIICGPAGIPANVQGKLKSYTWNLIQAKKTWFEVREVKTENSWRIYRLSPPEWNLRYIRTAKSNRIFEFNGIFTDFCILDHKIPSIAWRLQEIDKINIGEFPYPPGSWINELKQAFRDHDHNQNFEIDGTIFSFEQLKDLLIHTSGYSVGYAMDHLGGGKNHEILKDFFKNVDLLYIESFFRNIDFDYAKRHHHSTAFLSGTLAREAGAKKLMLVHHSRRYLSEIHDLLEEGRAAYENREPVYEIAPVRRYSEEDFDE